MLAYHDTEWGTPCYDDAKLFEYVVLDTFQAGLSWAIIMKKRENFRRAFDSFNTQKIASYDEQKINVLLQDAGIIRNRLKIRGTVRNAQAFLATQKEFGSFAKYLWQFVGGQPIVHQHTKDSEIGATSPESDAMSKDILSAPQVARDLSLSMKKRGFTFCGSTVCYAFMQGAGLVNDHLISCFRYTECNDNTQNR